MTALLHISDTHFGTVRPEVQSALLRFAANLRPELVLLTGDITQRARRSQFAAARHFLNQLGAPVIAVAGNHDIPLFNLPARICNPFGNYRRYISSDLEPRFESPTLLVIGVNTTRASRHTDGAVSAHQVERVAKHLRAATPGQLRIVIQHHPVHAAEASDLGNLLIGREQAVPAWVDAGMDLLLAGHIHLPCVHPLRGNTSREALTIQAGTALSSRTRGEVDNSCNVIRYEPPDARCTEGRTCTIERWDFSADSKEFVTVKRHRSAFHEVDIINIFC